MPLPVQLKNIVDAMEPLADEWHAYINRNTGEIIAFSDEEAMMAEAEESEVPEWLIEELPKMREALSSEDYVALPGKFDFHEYAVMERFANSLSSAQLCERLLHAMRGRGAFGRFKQAVHEEEIEQQWFAYRDLALKELAIDFLKAENIPFIDK